MKNILFAIPLVVLLLLVLLLASRRPVGNYSDPGEPIFLGHHASENVQFDGRLKVVAWNLHYAEKLGKVIAALENVDELRNADVLLLQEINAVSVEEIAQRLKYNYVYYPAAFNRQRREEYGNAILSKWPLTDPAKIVLPNRFPGWRESRNAARAAISVGNNELLVYSVHLDPFWIIPKWANSQGDFLIKEVGKAQPPIVLGGDFNTWTAGSISLLENGLEKLGLKRLNSGKGYTFEYSGLRLTLDHIFSMDRLEYQAGVYRQTDASDHYPVWADIALEEKVE